jgi:hypothetical protein
MRERTDRSDIWMDLVYILILAGLYAVTHALVWALKRLGNTA